MLYGQGEPAQPKHLPMLYLRAKRTQTILSYQRAKRTQIIHLFNISDRSCIIFISEFNIPEDISYSKAIIQVKIGTLSETCTHHKYVFLYKPGCPDFCGLTQNLSTRTPMNSRRHLLTRAAFHLFHRRAFKRAACCCLCHHERTGFGNIRATAQEILYSGKSFRCVQFGQLQLVDFFSKTPSLFQICCLKYLSPTLVRHVCIQSGMYFGESTLVATHHSPERKLVDAKRDDNQ